MTVRSRLLFELCVCAPILMLTGCATEGQCDLDSVTRDVGGNGLMDCGVARADTRTVDACAVAAHEGRNTFRALYEQDNGELEAIVHAAGGTYHLLRVTDDGAIERADCSGAHVAQDGARRYVACDGDPEFELECE